MVTLLYMLESVDKSFHGKNSRYFFLFFNSCGRLLGSKNIIFEVILQNFIQFGGLNCFVPKISQNFVMMF